MDHLRLCGFPVVLLVLVWGNHLTIAAFVLSTDLNNSYICKGNHSGYSLINGLRSKEGQKWLSVEDIPDRYKNIEYLRNPIAVRADEILQELANGVPKPFTELTLTSDASVQTLGQKPITFVREVLAAVSFPKLMESGIFASDVIAKAMAITKGIDAGTIGSYGSAIGETIVRKHVADFITRRDGGIPSEIRNIFLSDGISDGLQESVNKLIRLSLMHKCLALGRSSYDPNINRCNDTDVGMMIPFPAYSIYFYTFRKYGVRQFRYKLNESNDWALEEEEMQRSYDEALCSCIPRAIVVISPGNPTGKVFTRDTMEMIIKFAFKHQLVILADEAFQHNVFGPGVEFLSFKRVLIEMGPPYNNNVELISFYSVSKGFIAESGIRGGYFEAVNLDPKVYRIMSDLKSLRQCPNILGQVGLDCLVNPPKEGDSSFKLFEEERESAMRNQYESALRITEGLNNITGFSCGRIDGTVVAFPKVTLPPKAIQVAEREGISPDMFYSLDLLDTTGIKVLPG